MSLIGNKESVICEIADMINDEYQRISYGINSSAYNETTIEEGILKIFLLDSNIQCEEEENDITTIMSCTPVSCNVKVTYTQDSSTIVYSQEGKLEYTTNGTESNLIIFNELRGKEIRSLFLDSYLFREVEDNPQPGQFKFSKVSGLITFSDPLESNKWILILYK